MPRKYKKGICAGGCQPEPLPLEAKGLCRTCYQRQYREHRKEMREADLRENPGVLTSGERVAIIAEIMAVAKAFARPLHNKHLPQSARIEMSAMQDRLLQITHDLSVEHAADGAESLPKADGGPRAANPPAGRETKPPADPKTQAYRARKARDQKRYRERLKQKKAAQGEKPTSKA